VPHAGEEDALLRAEEPLTRPGQRLGQDGRPGDYCHRARAASWKLFHCASRLPRSRTTVSK
jgi:hypothetical protein